MSGSPKVSAAELTARREAELARQREAEAAEAGRRRAEAEAAAQLQAAAEAMAYWGPRVALLGSSLAGAAAGAASGVLAAAVERHELERLRQRLRAAQTVGEVHRVGRQIEGASRAVLEELILQAEAEARAQRAQDNQEALAVATATCDGVAAAMAAGDPDQRRRLDEAGAMQVASFLAAARAAIAVGAGARASQLASDARRALRTHEATTDRRWADWCRRRDAADEASAALGARIAGLSTERSLQLWMPDALVAASRLRDQAVGALRGDQLDAATELLERAHTALEAAVLRASARDETEARRIVIANAVAAALRDAGLSVDTPAYVDQRDERSDVVIHARAAGQRRLRVAIRPDRTVRYVAEGFPVERVQLPSGQLELGCDETEALLERLHESLGEVVTMGSLTWTGKSNRSKPKTVSGAPPVIRTAPARKVSR